MLRRLTLIVLVGIFICTPQPLQAQSGGMRVLVMPFDNPDREPRLHWIAEAASLLVADELNARGVPAIRRAERLDAFDELHLPPAATLSRATVIKVGQLVGASEVISGTVRLSGD